MTSPYLLANFVRPALANRPIDTRLEAYRNLMGLQLLNNGLNKRVFEGFSLRFCTDLCTSPFFNVVSVSWKKRSRYLFTSTY